MEQNRFRGQLKHRINLLDTIISAKTASLKEAPEGKIYIGVKKDRPEYYLVDDNGTRSYISKKNIALISALIQKSYDMTALESSILERDLLSKTLEKYPDVSVDEYYSTMDSIRKSHTVPVRLTDEEYIKRWYALPCTHKTISADVPEIYTNKGERVRSKSEKIIADRLAMLGIPYKYEAALALPSGEIIHPDFTIPDMTRRCDVYLEHFGRMDDPDYVSKAIKRIRLYSANGITQGDKLFMSFETLALPLNVNDIDAIVKKFR